MSTERSARSLKCRDCGEAVGQSSAAGDAEVAWQGHDATGGEATGVLVPQAEGVTDGVEGATGDVATVGVWGLGDGALEGPLEGLVGRQALAEYLGDRGAGRDWPKVAVRPLEGVAHAEDLGADALGALDAARIEPGLLDHRQATRAAPAGLDRVAGDQDAGGLEPVADRAAGVAGRVDDLEADVGPKVNRVAVLEQAV